MRGLIANILSRHKEIELATNAIDDFELSDFQETDVSFVASERNWSLYCLDHQTRSAMFVELPERFDLSRAAFSYAAQFSNATRVVVVPFAHLEALSKMVPFADKLIFVFSIGRCGSTLLSKIFSQIPDVWSLSEPDPVTQLAIDRHKYSQNEMTDLHRAAMRLAFRPPHGRESDTFVVKFRSQSSYCMQYFDRAFPNSTNLFLHREPVGWVNSFHRLSQNFGASTKPTPYSDYEFRWRILTTGSPTDQLEEFYNLETDMIFPEVFLSAVWLVVMREFYRAQSAGLELNDFSYEQLNNQREKTVTKLLDVCGFEKSHKESALIAYETDVQEGTKAGTDANTLPLTAMQRRKVREVLSPFLKEMAYGSNLKPN